LVIREVRTTCPLDCPCACGLSVEVEDNRATHVRAAKGSEINPCIKGIRAIDRVYHPDRLKYPLLRDGLNWKRISWDDALDILAAKTKGIIEKYGLNSIFYYSYNSGTLSFMRYVPERFLNVLGGVTMTVGSLCDWAGYEGLRYTTGMDWSVHEPKDWANSRYLIVWGKDPSLTWPPYYKYIRRAREHGAKMVVIDPVRNKTAEEADEWIPIRPGTDMALALGMANLIIAERLYDADYVNRSTNDFEKLVSFLAPYSVDWASRITSLKPETIRRLTEEYASTKPASIHAGVGAQHNTWGYDAMRAIAYLVALTGNFGIPGGGLNYYGGSLHFPFNLDALTLESVAKHRVNIPIPKMAEYILKGKPAEARMIWVAGGNPVDMAGNSGRMLEAFRSVEFSVVIEQFMSSTAKVATMVLPAAHYLEFDDVIPSWGHTLIQPVNRAIDPPGEARNEYQIFSDLARRMGLGQHFSKSFLELLDEVLAPAGMTVADLRQRNVIPAPQPLIPFEHGVFQTKSGKFEFYSEEMKNLGLDGLPTYKVPPEGVGSDWEKKYPLAMATNRVYGLLNSQYVNTPKTVGIDEPKVTIHPVDAKARGVKEGEMVDVFNHIGKCQLKAEISERTTPGVVVMYVGWWWNQGQKGGANFLTSDRYSALGNNSVLKEVMVEVSPVRN